MQWDSTTGEDHYVFATLYIIILQLLVVLVWVNICRTLYVELSLKLLIGRDNVVWVIW
jgi:hypothetical protein